MAISGTDIADIRIMDDNGRAGVSAREMLQRQVPECVLILQAEAGLPVVHAAEETTAGRLVWCTSVGIAASDLVRSLLRQTVLTMLEYQRAESAPGLSPVRLARLVASLILGTDDSGPPHTIRLAGESSVVSALRTMAVLARASSDPPELRTFLPENLRRQRGFLLCATADEQVTALALSTYQVLRGVSTDVLKRKGFLIPNPFYALNDALSERARMALAEAMTPAPVAEDAEIVAADAAFAEQLATRRMIVGCGRHESTRIEMRDDGGIVLSMQVGGPPFAMQMGPDEPYSLWDTSVHPIRVSIDLHAIKDLAARQRVRIWSPHSSIIWHPHILEHNPGRIPFSASLCMGKTQELLIKEFRRRRRDGGHEIAVAPYLLALLQSAARVLKYGSNHRGRARRDTAEQLKGRVQGMVSPQRAAELKAGGWEVIPYREELKTGFPGFMTANGGISILREEQD